MFDPVNHPQHYKSHPSGIEAIDICEHEDFLIGNALKYLLRHQHKGNPIQDLEKARWYLDRKIQKLKNEQSPNPQSVDPMPVSENTGDTEKVKDCGNRKCWNFL